MRGVPRLFSSLWTSVLALVMALAVRADPVLVAATIVLVQLQIAVGPHPTDGRGRTVRAPKTFAVAAAGLTATALTLWPRSMVGADGTRAGDIASVLPGSLMAILPATALGVVLAFVSQMFRRDERHELVSTTAHAAMAALIATLSVGWITSANAPLGAEVLLLGAVGTAVSVLVWALPGDRYVMAGAAMVASGVACALVAHVQDGYFLWTFGLLMGSQVSLGAILGQVVGRAWSEGRRHAAAGWGFPGAVSIALAGPLVHLIGQLGNAV